MDESSGAAASLIVTEDLATPPLIEIVQRRALCIQAGLDRLATNEMEALVQLEANRDAALAAVRTGRVASVEAAAVVAAFSAGVDAVQAAAARKRAGLETELAEADAAHGELIDAIAALAEVGDARRSDTAHMPNGAALRYAAAEAAATAIPEQPVTSCFLLVLPVDGACPSDDGAGLLSELAIVWVNEPPAGLTCAQAVQLQAWLPRGGSRSPADWELVYCASTHGFGAAAFHERCDERARLLVLVRAREGGWLFGGFTAVGFSPPERFISDPAAFLFSLTNSLGHPERLVSRGLGAELRYHPSCLASFGCWHAGWDVLLCDNANTMSASFTQTGRAFAESASTGAHPMARGTYEGWHAAEVLAWAV